MHYVGMDCHITTLDFAVVDDAGRLVKSCKVDTSAKNFMEFVKSVAAPRIVYMEESALAAYFGVKEPPFRSKPAGLSEQSRPPFRTKSATP